MQPEISSDSSTVSPRPIKKVHHRIEITDCLSYLLFLGLFTSVCVLGRSYGDLNYYATQAQRNVFLKSEISGDSLITQGERPFLEITQEGDIWAFQENIVIPSLFRRNYVDQKAYLQGGIKMRIIRRVPATCKPEWDSNLCFPSWKLGYLGIQSDSNYLYNYSFPVTYGSTNDNRESPLWYGKTDTYPGSGYTLTLPPNQTKMFEYLLQLKRGKFLSAESKVLFIDHTLYNPYLEVHTLTRQVFEFPISGGIIPQLEVKTWNFKRYRGIRGNVQFVLEIILVGILLRFTFTEIQDWRNCWKQFIPNESESDNRCHNIRKFKNFWFRVYSTAKVYFSDRWNFIDLMNVIFFWSTVALRIYQLNYVKQLQLESIDEYVPLKYLEYLYIIEVHLMTINGFLLWIKMFKYFTFSRRIRFLFAMFEKVGVDLVVFGISLLVFVFAFATTAFLSFSSDVYEFRSFSSSILNLIRFIVSDMDLDSLSTSNKIFGPIFYCSWNLLIILVLANIFIAILSDAYSIVNLETREETFSFGGFQDAFGKYFSFLTNWKDVDKDGDGHISKEELSTSAGISQVEACSVIEIFDQDGDGKLNENEAQMLRQNTQIIINKPEE
jgi:hypothetical protein